MSEHVVATAAAAATAGDAATAVDELPDLPGLGLCDDACDGDDADEDGVLLRRGGTGPANEADACAAERKSCSSVPALLCNSRGRRRQHSRTSRGRRQQPDAAKIISSRIRSPAQEVSC